MDLFVLHQAAPRQLYRLLPVPPQQGYRAQAFLRPARILVPRAGGDGVPVPGRIRVHMPARLPGYRVSCRQGYIHEMVTV